MVHLLVIILEVMFFIGLAGSMIVAGLAFVGDILDFFEKDKPESSASHATGD